MTFGIGLLAIAILAVITILCVALDDRIGYVVGVVGGIAAITIFMFAVLINGHDRIRDDLAQTGWAVTHIYDNNKVQVKVDNKAYVCEIQFQDKTWYVTPDSCHKPEHKQTSGFHPATPSEIGK